MYADAEGQHHAPALLDPDPFLIWHNEDLLPSWTCNQPSQQRCSEHQVLLQQHQLQQQAKPALQRLPLQHSEQRQRELHEPPGICGGNFPNAVQAQAPQQQHQHQSEQPQSQVKAPLHAHAALPPPLQCQQQQQSCEPLHYRCGNYAEQQAQAAYGTIEADCSISILLESLGVEQPEISDLDVYMAVDSTDSDASSSSSGFSGGSGAGCSGDGHDSSDCSSTISNSSSRYEGTTCSGGSASGIGIAITERPNILCLGMTRLPFFDHHTSFEAAEAEIRHAVSDCNCNLMRDTARILALESLGCDVFAVSLVDELAWERIVPDGGADTGPRFLNTSFATVGSRSRGFVECVLLKWPNVIFQSVYLDYYWLPDSVAWLQKGYMANNAGVIDNLIKMKEIGILARGFDVVLPVNTALVQCLEPLVKKLRANFAVHFISGDTEAIRPHHLAVQADSLIPPHVMSGVYCKNQQRQIDDMLGIKGSAAARALTILKRLVSGRTLARTPDLQDVRFLRLTPLPSDPLYIGPILCR